MRPTCPSCKNPMHRHPEVRWRCRACKPAKPDIAVLPTDKDMEYAKWLEWFQRLARHTRVPFEPPCEAPPTLTPATPRQR